jgi:hypothetical protein
MRMAFGRVALGALALSLVLPSVVVLTAGTALASPVPFPCGRIVAFTRPSATQAGSIQLGTTTYLAAPGSLPDPPPPFPVGVITCLNGHVDASGTFTELDMNSLGDQIVCGRVAQFTPPSGAAPGDLTLVTNATWSLAVRASVPAPAQTSSAQCFKIDIDGLGNTEVVGFLGLAPPPAPGRQLPSTATEPGDRAPPLALALLGAVLIGAVMRLRARSQ